MADESVENLLPFIRPGWVGVEIGVAHGHSALRLLQHGCRFLYLVDPYCQYPGIEGYEPDSRERDRGYEYDYGCCRARLAAYDDGRHFAFLRMPSAEAVTFIPGVDFVWVDGNHSYEYVKSDLEMYWPKVRPGGLLCGHDYVNAGSCQVARAVDEFVAARGLRLELALPCWGVRK